jgi:homocysteine S-methyltransferase
MEKILNPRYEKFEPFESLVQDKEIIILDGALGTQLEARGANLKNGLWSASLLKTHPELIKEVHIDYLKAGADIISTAGYQASLPAFIKNKYKKEEGLELIHRSVKIAVQARDEFRILYPQIRKRPLIAASMGPYGAYLADGSEYHGNYGIDKQELLKFHTQGLEILGDTEADMIAFETIPSLLEAQAIIEALSYFPKIHAWISFSCQNESLVSHGESIEECIREIQISKQLVAMGINCTSPEYIEILIRKIRPLTQKWIMAYPNKGDIYDPNQKEWSNRPQSLHFKELSQKWFEAGARIIGGCCGTTPENIQEIQDQFRVKP